MRIYLESLFAPNLSEVPYCPKCGLEEHPFAGDDRSWLKLGICRKCGYDCRSEFTQQLQEYVEELDPPVPEGVDIAASWQDTPRLDMHIDKSVPPAIVIKWCEQVDAQARMPAANFLGLLCYVSDERIEASRIFREVLGAGEVDELLVWIGQHRKGETAGEV
jgi:hypothetical protein